MKAATREALQFNCVGLLISIHAAREGGARGCRPSRKLDSISIHAARDGGDDELSVYLQTSAISIHAAREGGDLFGGVGRDAEA